MTVTLTYSGGSRDFTVYSVNPFSVQFMRNLHKGVGGGLREDSVGYRRVISVSFAALGYDKAKSFWLYGFLFGSARQVTWNAVTYDVTIESDQLDFDFLQETFFANVFSFNFTETSLSYITDTASTRILKPLYTSSGEGISGETLSIYADLVDDCSVEAIKTNKKFIDGNRGDRAFGYRHTLKLKTGAIFRPTFWTWLVEFALWGSKTIDTTAIDVTNGKVYEVVFIGEGINFHLSAGMPEIFEAELTFKEREIRTTAEMVISPVWDEVVFDEVVAQ